MIYLLLFTTIILLMFSYIVFDRDILSPSVVMCAMYMICICLAISNIDTWDIEYHFNTYIIVTLGMLSFIIAGLFITYTKKVNVSLSDSRSNVTTYLSKLNYNSHVIIVDKFVIIIFLLVEIITTIIYFPEIYRISIIGGNTLGYSGMMTYYRNYTSYNVDVENISVILSQFIKLCRGIGFVSLFIFVNNTIVNKNIKRDLYLVILTLLTIIQMLLSGGRGGVLWMVSVAFVASYVIFKRKNGWKKNINFKFIKRGIIIFVVLMVAFYMSKSLVRILNTSNSIKDYISSYAGGPIVLFDLYVQNPLEPTDIIGKETFYGLHQTLLQFGFSEIYAYYVHLEFRFSNGINIGNVYGAFRRYYHDFGIIGVIILQGLSSAFFYTYYNKIKRDRPKKYANFSLFLYGYLFYHVFEIPIDDNFFKSVISFNWVTTIIVFAIIYYVMVNIKIKRFKIKLV